MKDPKVYFNQTPIKTSISLKRLFFPIIENQHIYTLAINTYIHLKKSEKN